MICFSSISQAAPPNGVKYTPHNIGITGYGRMAQQSISEGATETGICVYCHTPHNSVAGKSLLWNREGVVTLFALYTGSPTLNISQTDKAAGISEVSKMCMSCHDGQTAVNSMANPRTGVGPNDPPIDAFRIGEFWQQDSGIVDEWGKNIGEWGTNTGAWRQDGGLDVANLTNDHPISFDYVDVQTRDQGIRLIAVPIANGLRFWGPGNNMVECTTCHDPHINYGYWDYRNPVPHGLGTSDTRLAPFLRRSNASSNLCLSCHDK